MSAAFGADGQPTPAALGFAKKQGVPFEAAGARCRRRRGSTSRTTSAQRGKSAVDALPDLLGGLLRDLSFPKQMHWDATLDDGRGELLFGRPIRWLLFLVWRPRRAVHHRAHAGRRRHAGAGGRVGRADLRPSLPRDERPRRAARSRCAASTSTGRACRSTSSSSSTPSAAIGSRASSRRTRGASAAASI